MSVFFRNLTVCHQVCASTSASSDNWCLPSGAFFFVVWFVGGRFFATDNKNRIVLTADFTLVCESQWTVELKKAPKRIGQRGDEDVTSTSLECLEYADGMRNKMGVEVLPKKNKRREEAFRWEKPNLLYVFESECSLKIRHFMAIFGVYEDGKKQTEEEAS